MTITVDNAPIYSDEFSSLYIYNIILYIIKWLCKNPYPCKNKSPPCHRCHRHRCQLWVSDKNLPLMEKFFSSGRKIFSSRGNKKKPYFIRILRKNISPKNQTMTDDSDDTHPNLFFRCSFGYLKNYLYLCSVVLSQHTVNIKI